MPVINKAYTPAGNRTVIHNNTENRITENYYRDWYDLGVRSPSRQGGDKSEEVQQTHTNLLLVQRKESLMIIKTLSSSIYHI